MTPATPKPRAGNSERCELGEQCDKEYCRCHPQEKPRAGEHAIRHTPETDEASDHCRTCGLDFADLDVSRKLEVERNDLLKASQAVPVNAETFRRTNGLRLEAEAERDLLRKRERELVEALEAMLDYGDSEQPDLRGGAVAQARAALARVRP